MKKTTRKRTVKELRRYAIRLAGKMGFSGWTIYITDDRPVEWGNHAEITVIHSERIAYIEFRCDWKQASPEDLRDTVVHELVHMWTNTAFHAIRQLEPVVSEDVYKVAIVGTGQWIEHATSQITRCITPHMPLY